MVTVVAEQVDRQVVVDVLARPCGRLVLFALTSHPYRWEKMVTTGRLAVGLASSSPTDDARPYISLWFVSRLPGDETVYPIAESVPVDAPGGVQIVDLLSWQSVVDLVVIDRATHEYQHFLACFETNQDLIEAMLHRVAEYALYAGTEDELDFLAEHGIGVGDGAR